MTVGGWIAFGIIALCVLGFCLFIGTISDEVTGIVISLLIGVIISIFICIGMHWYFNNTASGQRAIKTQESNFNMGIDRKVCVYDATGNLIKEYEGKFDVDYDDDRIIFDDENGLRHIIYYPTGTVIIDEVSK